MVQVWLTALLTLGSGVPQLTCVCPNGRVKPFCLSILPGLAGCCCGAPAALGRCCCAGHAPAASTSERPCCAVKRGAFSVKQSSHAQAESPRCRKTLAPSAVAVVDSPSTIGRPASDLSAPVLAFAVESGAGRLTRTSDARRGQRPPPHDLIVALQRLVI